MGEISGLAALGASTLVTAYLWERMWKGRRRISCMTGMMVSMAGGMMLGLSGGTVAAGLMDGPLWPPTLVGMAVGVLGGIALGAPVGLMAVLDGSLAGLMGGMMGAMLGLMAREALPEIAAVLLIAYLAVTGLLVQILRQEAGDEVQILRPIDVWILVLSVFVMGVIRPLGISGQAAVRETAPPIDHSRARSNMNSSSTPRSSERHGGAVSRVVPTPTTRSITVEVKASDYNFDKKEVRIIRGQPVRLVLRNSGSAEHDFAIEGLVANVTSLGRHGDGLHVHALPGQTDVVEFVPLRSGTYQAICTIPGHREAGMEVAITVID